MWLIMNRKASYQPTFSQLDGDEDPPPSPPTSTLLPTQSSPPVTPPRTSRPYPHPPPLSPKAKSELTMIPPKSENYCCHCRTECPCTFGYRCRGCPARQGGRPHHCDRCPGNWCHIKPPDFLWTTLVMVSICDSFPVVFFNAQCATLWIFHKILPNKNDKKNRDQWLFSLISGLISCFWE